MQQTINNNKVSSDKEYKVNQVKGQRLKGGTFRQGDQKMTFGLRLNKVMGETRKYFGKNVSGRGQNKYKGPKAMECLTC